MEISPEVRELIAKEEEILADVILKLKIQFSSTASRLRSESTRAQALTSEIVSLRVAEEKELLASDEAVSHKLRDMKIDETKALVKLLDRPYFARIVLEEEINGKLQEIEYKIGVHSNTDCRIVDWRKGPISRLYYEYKEGDEFEEVIQDRERFGKVLVRNNFEIEKGELVRLTCRHGSFVKEDGEWKAASGAAGKRRRGSGAKLPEVFSVITPEQFSAITEDVNKAVVIRGIAGSGKTTVALHRLSWIVKNTSVSASNCLVVVRSPVLKRYIDEALGDLDLLGAKVLSYDEWVSEKIKKLLPGWTVIDSSSSHANHAVLRVKSSLAMLKAAEKQAKNADFNGVETIVSLLQRSEKILNEDESNLLDREIVGRAYKVSNENYQEKLLDVADASLLIHIDQLLNKEVSTGYEHVVVDEVQDFDAVSLAAIVGAAKKRENLTLAGDAAQSIRDDAIFPGWERLRMQYVGGGELSTFVSLSVSHRSTFPIMRLADFVLGERRTKKGRSGRVPIWFHCDCEDRAVKEAITWLEKAQSRYPDYLTAVLCSSQSEVNYVLSILEPTFGASVRAGDTYSFSFDEGIIVTSVAMVKGLEFTNVLIWDPSRANYPKDQSKKLYTAITRAEDNLCLVSWNRPTKLLPYIYSKLVRGYEKGEFEDGDSSGNQRTGRPRSLA